LGWKGVPCQNKCVYCYDSKYEFAKLVKKNGPEQVAQISSELDRAIDWEKKSLKIEEVYLAGGGEPTLYPHVANDNRKIFKSRQTSMVNYQWNKNS
jgi:wyosine [tRNA(Phe)-imidazoG37] synthetase (radical SAM superfamily)